ncbi:uncharacterized protein BDR25DRAFT_393691 [Lindgomyces ingoldianus]|uniref:Uncharacterized protein n=1 Tax=Lindgomyces ingoldianus TaxID=673940 RepID=A0ACB6QVG7_9PLEO|nr:uncharacterized protein BDR25DRAFT_393691 [Lindgomyces ingoldianus]KAF2470573.1 hypothetical protein BDR25DRAFT_393691 [Lindgomyces ingoldianus]
MGLGARLNRSRQPSCNFEMQSNVQRYSLRRPRAPTPAVVLFADRTKDLFKQPRPHASRAHRRRFLDQAAAEILSPLIKREQNEIGEWHWQNAIVASTYEGGKARHVLVIQLAVETCFSLTSKGYEEFGLFMFTLHSSAISTNHRPQRKGMASAVANYFDYSQISLRYILQNDEVSKSCLYILHSPLIQSIKIRLCNWKHFSISEMALSLLFMLVSVSGCSAPSTVFLVSITCTKEDTAFLALSEMEDTHNGKSICQCCTSGSTTIIAVFHLFGWYPKCTDAARIALGGKDSTEQGLEINKVCLTHSLQPTWDSFVGARENGMRMALEPIAATPCRCVPQPHGVFPDADAASWSYALESLSRLNVATAPHRQNAAATRHFASSTLSVSSWHDATAPEPVPIEQQSDSPTPRQLPSLLIHLLVILLIYQTALREAKKPHMGGGAGAVFGISLSPIHACHHRHFSAFNTRTGVSTFRISEYSFVLQISLSHPMAVQLQWSLDSTSDSFLALTRGFIRAATSDNVSPVAITVCNAFGSTIAMCQETSRRIEAHVAPTPNPAIINFLQATAGYSKDDCASIMSRTLGGVQFLGLAAAIVSSMNPLEGARALDLMLRESASEESNLPTLRQLKEFLVILEARCNLSAFADTVVGWQIFLTEKPVLAPVLGKSTLFTPPPEGVAHLVRAFRELHRLGDSSASKIIIHTTSCTAWVVAFTKWCLGVPPSVFSDEGTPILEQPDSTVSVITRSKSNDDSQFQVEVLDDIGVSLLRLAAHNGEQRWAGMVGIGSYGQWLLREFSFYNEATVQTLEEMLPYALHQTVTSLKFSRYRLFDNSGPIDNWPETASKPNSPQIINSMLELGLTPFPEYGSISRIISLAFNMTEQPTIRRLEEGTLIADLPVMNSYLQTLEKHCHCSLCSQENMAAYESCAKDRFFWNAAHMVADILALSLFHGPHAPLIWCGHTLSSRNSFVGAIYSILTAGSINHCEIYSALEWAHDLVGHNVLPENNPRDWIMSCYKGQVIYPAIFDYFSVRKHGFLAMFWLPGSLRYKGGTYSRVQSSHGPVSGEDPITATYTKPVSQLCNLVPGLRLSWKVKVGDDVLEASVSLDGMGGTYSHITYPPGMILPNLASALLVEACQHEHGQELATINPFLAYTGPIRPVFSKNNMVHKVGVVAVSGANDMRLFSLICAGYHIPIILRGNACLACCIDIYRKTRFPVIVL